MTLMLGLETSSARYGVALVGAGEILFDSSRDFPDAPARDLWVLAARGLEYAGRRVQDVGLIAVNIGPGSLSAIRTGVSFANGLAFSLEKPIYAVTSFELMGLEAWERTGLPVLCTRRARDGYAYAGIFDGTEVTKMRFGSLGAIVTEVAGNLDELAVAGTFRHDIGEFLPGSTIVDSGIEAPESRTFARIASENSRRWREQHSQVSPLNEQSEAFNG